MTDHVDSERSGGVLTLSLNRPDKKNALTQAMYGALADHLTAAQADDAVRAVIIRSEGDMFTAGNDLSDFAAAAATADGASLENVWRFLHALVTITKPLLAAVQGRAVGIGTTMLLHCDHVVLADDAVLSAPFVNLGLVPEAGSSVLLPARIGHPRAFAMMALGQPMAAQEALACGLANQVVAVGQVAATARDAAERFSRQPPAALIATKSLMRDVAELSALIDAEAEVFVARLASPEAREAFAAFAEKRPPRFAAVADD
jgi:enoyl-CoA hydratase/carnithine racemase